MSGFRTVAEHEEFRGRLIRLVTATVEAPDGETLQREVVHVKPAVAVVPVLFDPDGAPTVILVRQFRVALGGELLEIPAGMCDVDGESLEETAQRELAEEIGHRAGRLEPLATFHGSPGFSDARVHVFVGLDLEEVGREADSAEERHMTLEQHPLADALELVARGEIRDAKTIIGLLKVRDRLASG